MTSLLCFPSAHVMDMVIKKILLKRQQFSENEVGLYSCCILTLSVLSICFSQIIQLLHSNAECSKHMLQSDYTVVAF
jgi:hypothetical protein